MDRRGFRASRCGARVAKTSGMRPVTLLDYSTPLVGEDGVVYRARACGVERDDHSWEAWLEFDAVAQSTVRRTERETTQPNLKDAVYWATGVSPVYLEGALARAS